MDMESYQKKKWVTLQILTLYLINQFCRVIPHTKLSTTNKKAFLFTN